MTTDPIGAREPRLGGTARVTGRQQFIGDIHIENELHVKLVHIDSPHARILSIDTARAAEARGVHCVVSADDLPRPMPRFGPVFEDRPILATGETKYHGQPVAAVVAESKDAAEAAVDLVRVEFEALPGGFTVAGPFIASRAGA